jgi:hypothetical protein
MLDARNVRIRERKRGLSPKNLGPFKITDVYHDGKACKLDLANHADLKGVYPVFHPWLLHHQDMHPLPGQAQEPQGPVAIDNDDTPIYEITEIVDSKLDH